MNLATAGRLRLLRLRRGQVGAGRRGPQLQPHQRVLSADEQGRNTKEGPLSRCHIRMALLLSMVLTGFDPEIQLILHVLG